MIDKLFASEQKNVINRFLSSVWHYFLSIENNYSVTHFFLNVLISCLLHLIFDMLQTRTGCLTVCPKTFDRFLCH